MWGMNWIELNSTELKILLDFKWSLRVDLEIHNFDNWEGGRFHRSKKFTWFWIILTNGIDEMEWTKCNEWMNEWIDEIEWTNMEWMNECQMLGLLDKMLGIIFGLLLGNAWHSRDLRMNSHSFLFCMKIFSFLGLSISANFTY